MRGALTAGICIGAIALPAVALGGPPDPEYGGKIDGKKGHYIGFDIGGVATTGSEEDVHRERALQL